MAAFDEALRRRRGASLLAGVDEAGRGPLAGPVVAAAVILPPAPQGLSRVRDSKVLSPARREELARLVRRSALAWGVGAASVSEIESRNILQATFLAMRRALEALGPQARAARVIVDGDKDLPGWDGTQEALVDGDAQSLCVASASILAKTVRDRWMRLLDPRHPGYGLAKHKGYGTKDHYEALGRLGLCAAHRPSFLKRLTPPQAVR
ncbi:MAG: ribonuclease HII [Elusimicrobia bacterium]|nr:ribonuclease HII [Elusimicrobiota bacterium]